MSARIVDSKYSQEQAENPPALNIQISPAMELKILKAMQASKEGRTKKVHSKEELHALLESL